MPAAPAAAAPAAFDWGAPPVASPPASPPTVAPSWDAAPAAGPSAGWDIPKTEEPAAPPAPSWSAPAAPPAPPAPRAPEPEPVPPAIAPPPWNVPPAPAWSPPAASPAPIAPAEPLASTDADLAAGAQAAVEEPVAPPAPQIASPPWRGPDNNEVAATMIAPPPMDGGGAEREPTTVMPAWQPPPTAPPVPETMAMPARTQPVAGVSAGPQAELTIESGPDGGHTHRATDAAVRLGRSPDNDVILRDPATSGHHARLERRGDDFWLVDLGSTNGTFVNGESVQEKQLNHGDRITVGQNSLHFSLVGA